MDPLQTNNQSLLDDYLTETMVGDHLVIPSDIFELGGQEYLVLDIIKKEGIPHLKLTALDESNEGKQYLVPSRKLEDLKNLNLSEYIL
ncbi:MAG: hypothetical protein PHC89_01255 [Candidatus Pacebacteria bacterium]|nr:hypothetical protein [Candidatus Paceibacterota bacterium]